MTERPDPDPGHWVPSKAWGQNYLVNTGVIDKIVGLLPDGATGVVEIGSGRGALTVALLARDLRVLAVEPHEESARYLERTFGSRAGFELLQADATSLDFAGLSVDLAPDDGTGRAPVVGNLPYCVAARILFNLIRTARDRSPWILMFQREVAQRIVAAPGSRDYGLLSVVSQLAARCRLCFQVQPGSFSPAPKVMSAVVRFEPTSRVGPEPDWDRLSAWLAGLFSRRRKQLGNCLAALLPPERMARVRADPTWSLTSRPEQLTPEDHLALFNTWGRDKMS
jgi:16S rRNA (adenine1518-N6/adenine1519-N6)-dimethyltransferase